MEVFLNITNWYDSPNDTFIRMYIAEKAPHVLPRISTEKLVM